MTSHQVYKTSIVYVWHRMHYGIWCMTSYALWHPHFMASFLSVYDIKVTVWWHHTHCIWHHIHSICVITPMLLIISHPLYMWHHTVHTYYSVWTLQTSHPVFLASNHNNYDMASTLFKTLYSLYITLHPLYLCHHTHSIYDITMTVWPHTQYIFEMLLVVKTFWMTWGTHSIWPHSCTWSHRGRGWLVRWGYCTKPS